MIRDTDSVTTSSRLSDTSEQLPVIGIVGAGAMGAGIAFVAARRGHHVVLADAAVAALDRARGEHGRSFDRDVEKERLTREQADLLQSHVSYVDAARLDGFSGCGVVIEAIVEQVEIKRSLFRQLEAHVGADTILASNTSSLSIAAISSACRNPERVVGIHFFNPAAVMPLVEIIPSLSTADDVTSTARALVDSWGKTTVVASDTPGFIVNRIARPFYGESLRIYEEGIADFATIDWAMRELAGFRMGPFELMDFIGNDVNYAVTASVFEAMFFDPRYRPSQTQRRLVEAGLLGRKSGRGYYEYRDGVAKREPLRDEMAGRAVVDRILAMLVNEAADALMMRVASARDIELAMVKGVNYPKGLLSWGDEIGASVVLQRLDALYDEYREDRYRASPLLRRVAGGTGPGTLLP